MSMPLLKVCFAQKFVYYAGDTLNAFAILMLAQTHYAGLGFVILSNIAVTKLQY